MCVQHSSRGIGWNHEVGLIFLRLENTIYAKFQVPNLPSRPTESRWDFVRSRLLKATTFFLLVDLGQSYTHSNPIFSLTGDDVLHTTAQGYILRCLNVAAWVTIPYGMLSMQYNVLASLAVAVGYSEPKYWPALFGSVTEGYTLRRFWR